MTKAASCIGNEISGDPKPRRRLRFRLRLRTILLLVALLAIPCAWFGSQVKLVSERRAMLHRVEESGNWRGPNDPSWPANDGWISILGERRAVISIIGGEQLTPISSIRRWLGDRDVADIEILSLFPDGDKKRLLELFPGTTVIIIPVTEDELKQIFRGL